jgi:phospholipid/cholesterol/gamma-HCH transport system substrate-binding protein
MSHHLLPRMIALIVVIVLGVYYIVFDVLQVRVISQPFAVTVLMPSAGGLYAGADVTYRGVQVGKVTALDLSQNEVAVKLGINPGEHIPDNGSVDVKELSALGENYVDLQPTTSSGPKLENGTVIPASRVTVPVPIGTALIDLGSMLKSINPSDLQTVESFLTTAFIGTGPDLRTIIVTGQQLFDALVAAQPETVNLVVDGRTDLKTLGETDGDLATFTKGLAALTGQLRNSNSDLQALIRNGQAAEQQLNPFLAANNAAITGTISDLAIDSQVSDENNPEVRAIFELLPMVSDDLASVASGGQVRGVLDFNVADTVCPYIPGADMPGPTQQVTEPTANRRFPGGEPPVRWRSAQVGADQRRRSRERLAGENRGVGPSSRRQTLVEVENLVEDPTRSAVVGAGYGKGVVDERHAFDLGHTIRVARQCAK